MNRIPLLHTVVGVLALGLYMKLHTLPRPRLLQIVGSTLARLSELADLALEGDVFIPPA
jgi:hypothetical protein